jgi:hypothetical protein
MFIVITEPLSSMGPIRYELTAKIMRFSLKVQLFKVCVDKNNE